MAINAPDMTMNQIVQFIKYDSNYGQYDGEIQVLIFLKIDKHKDYSKLEFSQTLIFPLDLIYLF